MLYPKMQRKKAHQKVPSPRSHLILGSLIHNNTAHSLASPGYRDILLFQIKNLPTRSPSVDRFKRTPYASHCV